MSYRVIDDTQTKEDNMCKMDKPRLAEVLGVEVGERFMVKSIGVRFFVDEDGIPKIFDGDSGLDVEGISIYYAINHPESIIRATRLTEAETAIMRAVGAKWVSYKPHDSCFVMLTKGKPEWDDKYQDYLLQGDEIDDPIGRIRGTLFPSVHPGDCISVEEATP